MPAYRGINLRSGDLAEQLGVLLLQSVALVAPVPRTEDVGIDVVATLIRKYDGYKYIAEDSFFVQIKSVAETEILFKGDQVKWLNDLHLPLFIATVDRSNSKIKLYTTQSLSDAFVENPDRKVVNLKLLDEYGGDISDKDEMINLPIGPAVIEWSLDELETNPNFIQRFYDLMKIHVSLSKKSIETRRVGYVDLLVWETGSIPRVYAQKVKGRDDRTAVDEIAAPYLHSIIHNLTFGNDIGMTRSLYNLFGRILEQEDHFHIVDGKRELKAWTNPNTGVSEQKTD
ncbi:hypothetical protein D3C87_298830 [compost metagenome]